MQYYSLQHQILLSSSDTSSTECRFCFGLAASFFLWLLVVLCSSPVAYWTPSDLRVSSLVSYLFVFLKSLWGSHSKYTGVVCHSLLQWITFCQNSAVTRPSWVALHGMANSFVELYKPLRHQGSEPWRGYLNSQPLGHILIKKREDKLEMYTVDYLKGHIDFFTWLFSSLKWRENHLPKTAIQFLNSSP